MALEITERLRCAKLWRDRFRKILCNRRLSWRAKFQLYKLFVRPILTYGCEVWNLDNCNSRKLLQFEIRLLCKIYKSNFSRSDPNRVRLSIRTVYNVYQTSDVLEHVKNERLRWDALLKNEERALSRRCRRSRRSVRFWNDCEPQEPR